ncbi:MAG: hypothetical protein H7A38_03480 [Chlamydiales bacterium]|nr:hypothetical protein [Chlamydiales bacterium]
MLFENCAQLKEEQIEIYKQAIKKELTEESFNAYLAAWGPWQKFTRRQQVPSYENLQVKTVAAIEECVISLETPKQPVILGMQFYDYKILRAAFINNGLNPCTRSSFDWKAVERAQEMTGCSDV